MAYITNDIKNVEGTNISINDSDQKILKDIQLQGDTYQYTTTGKNLFNINGTNIPAQCTVNITNNTLTQTNTSSYSRTSWGIDNLIVGQEYTLSYNFTNSSSCSIQPRIMNSTNATIIKNGTTTTATSGTSTTTFTATETTHYIRLYSNTLNSTNTNTVIFYNIQLEKGSATEYEPYTNGVSPNPDYPQYVKTVTGRQEITINNTNLIGLDTQQYRVSLRAGDKITAKNKGSSSVNINLFTNYGDTTRNDFWSLGAGATRTITVAHDSNAIAWNTTPNNLAWVNKGDTLLEYEEYNKTSYEINLGKNLYALPEASSSNSVNYTKNADGTINLSGTASANTTFYIYKSLSEAKITDGSTYTLSANKTLPSGMEIRCEAYNGTTWLRHIASPLTSSVQTKTGTANLTNATQIRYAVYVASGSNLTISNLGIQLEKGSTATTYSSYFEPIELGGISTYKDDILKSTGKNLFDINIFQDVSQYLTINSENICSVSIPDPSAYLFWKKDITSILKVGQSYKISFQTDNSTYGSISVDEYEGSTRTKSSLTQFTVEEGKIYYIKLYGNKTSSAYSGTMNIKYWNIQLEEGSTASEYEPYGKYWYKYNAIGKAVFDGSENWRTPSSTTNVINFCNLANTSIFDYRNDYDMQYCNILKWRFRVAGHQQATDSGVGLYTYINGNYKYDYFVVPKTIASTVTEWKTWLSNNNLILYYVLATPTYEKITNQELINQLDAIEIKEGINNIYVSSNDLSSSLKLSYYSTDNDYYDAIYSQDDKNDLKIWFNDVELQDAAIKCEKITRTARILPDNGNKTFSLDNFISTSLDVILHNVDVEDIVDQVKISIGTLVDAQNNTYQYIPLGVFNIQDTPENANGKITLKLRDNRVKFDFGYNAQPLIENNNGAATKKQILNDICSQAGVENTIDKFNGDSDLIGIYDNTITGSTYISYLMEQDGSIPIIDREGKLIKIELNKLYVWKIPLSILEGYELGEPYKIDRVVYESGIIKYETSSDETLDTLYLDAANPYFSNQGQVDYILNKLQNFEIDSVTTKRVLGNPAIDPYDLIQVYNDLDGTNDVLFTTLANTSYTYNGIHRDIFDTQIGIEQRKENVSLKGDATFQKYAKTSIDNINGEITLVAGTTNSNADNINNLTQMVNSQGESIDALGTRINQNVESITASVTALQSEIDAGVGLVKTTSVTINDDGLSVSTDTSKISTTMDNDSFEIKDSGDTTLAFFGYDEDEQISKAEMDNLTVDNYFVTGVHRIEKNEEGTRTLFFYIGG